MLVCYALGDDERDGHLDLARFADGLTSAAGWVGKVVGAMRTTRILREMAVESRELAVPLVLEQAAVTSAEDDALAAAVPLIEQATRGLPATSATLRIVHASALHELLGLPPLCPWLLTPGQGDELRDVLEHRPDLLRRTLRGDQGTGCGTVGEAVGVLWAGWSWDDAAAMLALSTRHRDIPKVLASAALQPLPRPTARSGELEHIRVRARDGVPVPAADAVGAVFEAFLDSRVDVFTDFDRVRHPLTLSECSRREASLDAFPALLRGAAHQAGVGDLDLLSGLIALFIEPLPVADPAFFTPTRWRFPT